MPRGLAPFSVSGACAPGIGQDSPGSQSQGCGALRACLWPSRCARPDLPCLARLRRGRRSPRGVRVSCSPGWLPTHHSALSPGFILGRPGMLHGIPRIKPLVSPACRPSVVAARPSQSQAIPLAIYSAESRTPPAQQSRAARVSPGPCPFPACHAALYGERAL